MLIRNRKINKPESIFRTGELIIGSHVSANELHQMEWEMFYNHSAEKFLDAIEENSASFDDYVAIMSAWEESEPSTVFAYAMYYKEGTTLYVHEIFVDEYYRGKDVASDLLLTIIKKAREYECEEIICERISLSNFAACGLFAKYDFEIIEELSSEYNLEGYEERFVKLGRPVFSSY